MQCDCEMRSMSGKKVERQREGGGGGEREAIPSTSLQQLSFRLKEGDEK